MSAPSDLVALQTSWARVFPDSIDADVVMCLELMLVSLRERGKPVRNRRVVDAVYELSRAFGNLDDGEEAWS
jgi:hypothetical protein